MSPTTRHAIRASTVSTIAVASMLQPAATQVQQVSSLETRELSCRENLTCVEETGQVNFVVDDRALEQAYVLRHPKADGDWNGRLLIGLHGETGAPVRYGRGGEVIGTHETQLDDMIGDAALSAGYAYASLERRGFGGRERGLKLLNDFTGVMTGRLSEVFGSKPTHRYTLGWSTGGTLARFAAEDTASSVDGVIVVAGVGGGGDDLTHVPLVPTIEIVGTGDARVAEGVRAYRDRVRYLSAAADPPTPADRFRVYEVQGARHLSPEDDDVPSFDEESIGEVSYFGVVQTALELLERWVTEGVPPPPDQVVVPPANIGSDPSR